MSQGNLEVVRRIYEGWAEGDFRPATELYDPLILLVQGQGFPEPGPYLGLDGVRKYMNTFLEAWDRVTIEAEELLEAGESVVAKVVQRAVGKQSGVEPTELGYFQVWTLRGGKVIRLDVIRDRADALNTAGLSESAADASPATRARRSGPLCLGRGPA
jgi:ketosteroid isomerase-like protein